ncbi:MAG: hypothetical protein JNJ46_10740 [Myxococcales bacterium]|nr:hypothetical protein [Myxococcales bacterium]
MRQVEISKGWQVKGRDRARVGQKAQPEEWSGETGWVAAPVPGTVHEALWQAGQIGSPYQLASLRQAAWIAESDFLYRCRFDLPSDFRLDGADAVSLCCQGLDTVATLWLNGVELLHSDNMFIPQSVTLPEGGLLRRRDNELWLLFESALRVGQAREAQYGKRPVWNGDPSRVYLRKAQYQYGWDFSPTVLSLGPWKPIQLLAYSARLGEVSCPLSVAPDLQTARLSLSVATEFVREIPAGAVLRMRLRDSASTLVCERLYPLVGGAVVRDAIDIEQPALWWPRGHGEQPLYELCLELFATAPASEATPLDARRLRLGARRLRLVEERLPDGENFYIEVNNRPIFCGGANWIPADVLPTRISQDRLAALLDEAVASEMTMLRVWGGGLYESDAFYDLCDERGLLVWQDFGFACGLYPAHPELSDSVAAEARAAVQRLRHHPSLVLWAGNNEDYAIAQSVGAYRGPRDARVAPGPSSLSSPRFDGRVLYEQVLARVCEAEDPSRPYWRGSPYSRHHADPNVGSEGDRHIWDVWHGAMRDYQDYGQIAGRFASEFGMQAVPDLAIARRCLAPKAVDEAALRDLNYGQEGPERIAKYIGRNLPSAPHAGVAGYVYLTQVNQAEAMAYAVRAFRRGFDATRRCSGALVWQLNDCWPSVSWSLLGFCDEGERPRRKASFYAVRRELLPWIVGLAPGTSPHSVAVWVGAPPLSAVEQGRLQVSVRLRAFGVDGSLHDAQEHLCAISGNQTTELGTITLAAATGPLVVGVQLIGIEEGHEQVLARAVLWPQPLRSLSEHAALSDPGLLVRRFADRVELSVQRPAKAVLLSTEGEIPVAFFDNLVDLLPDEPLAIEAPGLGDQPLIVRSLFGGVACP